MSMRPGRLLLLVLVAMMLLATPAAVAADPPELTFDGAGYGHGVGMSQWGAKGMADGGASAAEILAFYYDGSSVSTLAEQLPEAHWLVTDVMPLWVNLEQSITEFAFEAVGGEITVCHNGAGGCIYVAAPGEVWSLTALGDGTCQLTRDDEPVADPGNCRGTIKDLSPEGGRVRTLGLGDNRDEFARGKVRLRTADDGLSFHSLLTIDLEDYMAGIAEIFYSWPAAAQEAQAVAARSFSVSQALFRGSQTSFTEDRQALCWCHVYATPSKSQNYIGFDNEDASRFANWAAAVSATADQVVTHPAATRFDIAQTFYSASNPGASENNEDVWPGSALSYLRSKTDPFSADAGTGNPWTSWTNLRTEDAIAEGLDVDRIDGIEILERFDSGTPSRVAIYTRTGNQPAIVETTGAGLRSAVGLTGRHTDALRYGAIDTVVGDFDGNGVSEAGMFVDFSKAWWVGDFASDASPWANFGPHDGYRPGLVGDFTGDGRDDIATYRETNGKWLVAKAKASGSFKVMRWGSHPNTPGSWVHAVVGDFTGDGRDDIADYNTATGKVRVFVSTGSSFSSARWHTFAAAPAWSHVVAGDLDGDGKSDIVFRDAASGEVTVLYSQASKFTSRSWPSVEAAAEIIVGDVTGDGSDDVVAATPGSWSVLAAGPGRHGQEPAAWAPGPTLDEAEFARFGDFTGDGLGDIATITDGSFVVLTSTGDSFEQTAWGSLPSGVEVDQLHTADLDGDGLADIAIWSEQARQWWRARSSSGAFAVTAGDVLLG